MILWTEKPWDDGKTEVNITGASVTGLCLGFLNSSDEARMNEARANARLIAKAPALAIALLFEDAMHHQDFAMMEEFGWDPGGVISAGQFAQKLRTKALTGVPYLTKSQLALLEWLAREESSAHGECNGKDLDNLSALGLVSISEGQRSPIDSYSRVSVSDAGWSLLRSYEAKIWPDPPL